MEALAQLSIVLVDGQDLIRTALIQLLSGAGLDVVGERGAGRTVFGWCSTCGPMWC